MYGSANEAFVAVAGFKPTILISACVVVLVSGYGRVSYGRWGWGGQWRPFASSKAVLRLRAKDSHFP